MKEPTALFHINNFSCQSRCVTFKTKTSTCGSQVGHIRPIVLCSLGQWVKWVNRCDPLSALQQVANRVNKHLASYTEDSYSYYIFPIIMHIKRTVA